MAILRIKDAEGNVQEVVALRGEKYVLTDADKQEIVNAVMSQIAIPTVTEFQTEEQVLALIRANMPASAEEVEY